MSFNISTRYRTKPARADSTVDLGLPTAEGKQRVLEISTSKLDRVLVTRASVMTVDGNFSSHMLHADFSQRLSTHQAPATERNVRTQHEAVLRNVELILKSAREHYGVPAEHSALAPAAAA